MSVYAFLEVVDPKTLQEKPVEESTELPVEVGEQEEKPVTAPLKEKSKFYCEECEREFKTGASYGMHVGAKHPEKLDV